jgi:hypothetical protein
MRYNLESTLPIDAFSPRGGRGPFVRGMTLEGGGGGGIGKAIGKVFSPVAKAATQAVQAVVQPVYNATLKQIPGVDQALVGLDKTVGQSIPGGWGTVASIASTFIPGSQFGVNGLLSGITRTQLATGLGALAGSGVLKKGHEFNLQGAIMGGAMAYGGAKLSEGLQAAGQATPGGASAATEKALTEGAGSSVTPTANALSKLPEIPLDAAGNVAEGAANVPSFSEYYKPPVPPVSAPVPGEFVTPSAGEFGLKDVAAGSGDMGRSFVGEGAANQGLGMLKNQTPGLLGGPPPPGVLDKFATGTGDLLKGMGSNIADAGQGLANLSGLGSQTGAQSAAIDALTNKFGMGSATALITGAGGLMALEEQKKALQEQLVTGTIAQQEYNQAMQAIEDQEKIAREVVAANPFPTDSGVTGSLSGSGKDSPESYANLYSAYDSYVPPASSAATLYANAPKPSREKIFAKGGAVQDYGLSNLRKYALGGVVADDYSGAGPLDQGFNFNYPQQNQASNYPSPSNFDRPQPGPTTPGSYYQNFGLGSFGGYDSGMGYAAGGYAMGGEPRFLSGGGDGMSDSIKANINGSQEARLADGEFVIPADVVSHLGNGSSKAGAKQLYSMMDRVRSARTGRKSQGKQINPRKYMTA